MEFSVRSALWSVDSRELLALRRRVFIEEQGVEEDLEVDGLDPAHSHVLARRLEDGLPLGCGRMSADGRIGRVAVLAPFRCRGVGAGIMKALLSLARDENLASVHLHSQLAAREFYLRLGFTEEGEVFVEAGIPHVQMRRWL